MTALPPLRSILNDTPANAIDVDWNFQAIEDYVATDVIKRDGSVAMEAPLNLVGTPPTAPTHAVPKSYVDSSLPIGMLTQFAGPNAPAGWAICDGALKSTTDPAYAALFAVIQYAFGGSGGNFNLPDLRSRVPIGRNSVDPMSNTVGQMGGTRDTSLAAHSHTIAHGHTGRLDVYTSTDNTDHNHDFNHSHSASAGIQDAGHVHGIAGTAGRLYAHVGSGAGPQHTGPGSPGNPWADLSGEVTGPISANHSHAITVNGTGPIGTGNASAGNGVQHRHAINADLAINAIDTNSRSGTEGIGVGNANYPPFAVLNFIIRIG